ncbi:MAG: Glu-tRNA(Gln) amidotransferase subunit GatE [Candidatus Aenigmarchaeota archaeon]|nr:Glu-tRNA(Gln) amidotransferase subunit GatE [Candidatus Aenigmarchaeota archaeon]
MTGELNYRKLGLKAGLEIHQQLNTKYKLFCKCSTEMKEKAPVSTIIRKLHPVASELGSTDVAAEFEYLRNRTFHYQVFKNESCLVEIDCEPPHELNPEALYITLQIAQLFNCEIPNELHILRKTVIDGSNTSGFQRTLIVGLNGHLNFKGKKIEITQITLEEDAAAIVSEENGKVSYRLNRLGIPLVEIDTGLLEGYSPTEIQEIAYIIGLLAKSTGKTKRGIGSIRQDVNISIKNGLRVEVKGVQELGLISKVIENEVKRQLSEKVKEETRVALPDGATKFMRPLPGADRMYPETDIPPVVVDKEYLEKIKEDLPEPWTKKLAQFKSKLKLSDQLANETLRSAHLDLFEKIIKTEKVEPAIVASTLTQTLKDLERKEQIVSISLTEKHFLAIFDALEKKKIAKEAIPEILIYFSKKPGNSISTAITDLNLTAISIPELKKIVKGIITQPNITLDRAIGIVMSKVRGKIEAQTVIKTVKKMFKP